MRSRGVQSGFTLIEVVVVLTILAILAAFALPRLVQKPAAEVEALAESLRSGSATAHTVWIAAGNAPAQVALEGRAVAMTFGYPDEDAIHLVPPALGGFAVSAVGTTPRIFAKAGTVGCQVSYAEAPSADGVPAISIELGGCE